MQRRMPGMIAFFDQILRRLVPRPDLDKLLIIGMVFTEVGAEAALARMNVKHKNLLLGPLWGPTSRDDARGLPRGKKKSI